MLSQITVRATTERDRNYGLEVRAAPGEARVLICDLHPGVVYEASCPVDEQDKLVSSVFHKLNPNLTEDSILDSGTFAMASDGGYARASGKAAQALAFNGGQATAEGNGSHAYTDGPAESIALGQYAKAEAHVQMLTELPRWPSGDYRVHARASGDQASAYAMLEGGLGSCADADGYGSNAISHESSGTGSTATVKAGAGLYGDSNAQAGAEVVGLALDGHVALKGQNPGTMVYAIGRRSGTVAAQFEDGQQHFLKGESWEVSPGTRG